MKYASLALCLLFAACESSTKTSLGKLKNVEQDTNSQVGSGGKTLKAPIVAMMCEKDLVRAGTTMSCTVQTIDDEALASLELRFSRGNAAPVTAAKLAADATSLEFLVPNEEIPVAVLSLVATDADGLVTTAQHVFSADATPPLAPAMIVEGPLLTTASSVDLSVSECADRKLILVSAGAERPTLDDTRWQGCSTTARYTVSLPSDGIHTLRVWAKDALDVICDAPAMISLERDSTPPSLSLLSPLTSLVRRGVSASEPLTIGWLASDAHFSAQPIEISSSSDNGITFTLLANALAGTGEHMLTSGLGNGTFVFRVRATDSLGQTTSVTSAPITIDASSPAMQTVIIAPDSSNDGAASIGVVLAQVRVLATDNRSTSLSYAVREVALNESCSSSAPLSFDATGSGVQFLSLRLGAIDGEKKVCAWARDEVGNVSTSINALAPATPADSDTIAFFVSNPPRITALSVTNASMGDVKLGTRYYDAGDQVAITYTLTDAEALADGPLRLEVSVDNKTWTTLSGNIGTLGSDPRATSGSFTTIVPATTPSGYFRIRAVATDASGNTSDAVLSDLQVVDDAASAARWSVFAGSDDDGIGGSGRAVRLAQLRWKSFAVDPTTADIYAWSAGAGLYRLDSRTGLVSRFLMSGTPNLPSTGVLSDTAAATMPFIEFDSKGRLYLLERGVTSPDLSSGTIYQINVQDRSVRAYVGGGIQIANGAAPDLAWVQRGVFSFDEQDRLYYFASCTPGDYTFSAPRTALRLSRVAQQANGTAANTELIAGNCAGPAADPVGPFPMDPKTQPLSLGNVAQQASLAAFGDVVYYSVSAAGSHRMWKIIGGQLYPSNYIPPSPGADLRYSARTGKLFVTGNIAGSADGIGELTPNLSGSDGDSYSAIVQSTASGNCTADGVLASAACIRTPYNFALWPDGTLLFNDNFTTYRIRYIDTDQRVRTVMGSPAFFGSTRGVMQATFGGIVYRNTNVVGTNGFAGFRTGLYFVDRATTLFGRINFGASATGLDLDTPADDTVDILTGNQDALSVPAQDNTPFANAPVSLARGVTFDPTSNEPYLVASNSVVKLGLDGLLHLKQAPYNISVFWEDYATNTVSSTTSFFRNGGFTNMVAKATGLFAIGGYRDATRPLSQPTLSYFDFQSGGTVLKIIDSVSPASSPSGTSASAASLSDTCLTKSNGCFVDYDTTNDELYFSEDTRIRKLSTPTANARTGVISDVFVASLPAGERILNFTRSPDGTRLYYLHALDSDVMVTLSCHPLLGTPLGCDDSMIALPVGLEGIRVTANQFAWVNATTLFISNGNRLIYRYTVQ